MKPEWLSLPTVWPLKRSEPEQVETAIQILKENQLLPPSRRLVVILPDAEFDLRSLSKRIWDLAAPDHRQVLLMIKPCVEEDEFHVRVNLTTLAAFIGNSNVVVQTQPILGQSLVQAARQCAQPDDIFVCFEEHQVRGFLKKRPLAEMLAQSAQRPVYALEGTMPEMVDPMNARLIDFLILAFCFVSLIPFFALEVWIDRVSNGALQSILQMLGVLAEVWIIGTITGKSFQI
jgi:hypothetical protein